MEFDIIWWGKVMGGLGGVILSVSVLRPQNYIELVTRLISGLISAIAFTEFVANQLGLGNIDGLVVASVLCGFSGWFIFGLLARSFKKYTTISDIVDEIKKTKK